MQKAPTAAWTEQGLGKEARKVPDERAPYQGGSNVMRRQMEKREQSP